MSDSAFQTPRGTHDILPGESERWLHLETILRQVAHNAGYKEIRIPIFEHTELFKRGVGETTDIVNKEMYTFNDKSDRSLTLRPEGTAGVVRAYLNHGFSRKPSPVKLHYLGPMFRYERTQTGRQRQFHQFGIEAFGSQGPAIDAEIILAGSRCLSGAGLQNVELQLNSIGCNQCRPAYREKLKDTLRPILSELCPDCQERFERNPLRMLDCKLEKCQAHYQNLPEPLAHLCQECNDHWTGLLGLLQATGLKPQINPRLVRGLDYYGRTVFEFIANDERLGTQSTVLAGGRYDYFVETLGGPPTPGIGWALGMERLLLLSPIAGAAGTTAFVISDCPSSGLALVNQLRGAGISCDMDFAPTGTAARGFKRQFEQADKVGARLAIVLGEKERAEGSVTVKNMKAGTQETVAMADLIATIQASGL